MTDLEAAIAELKTALEGENTEEIEQKTQSLTQAAMKLGEAIYKAQQAEAEGCEPKGPPQLRDRVIRGDRLHRQDVVDHGPRHPRQLMQPFDGEVKLTHEVHQRQGLARAEQVMRLLPAAPHDLLA